MFMWNHLERNRRILNAKQLCRSSEITKTYILANPYIKSAAEVLGVGLDQRVTESQDWVGQNRVLRLHFYVLKNDIEDWKLGHAKLPSVEFRKSRGDYKYHGTNRKSIGHQTRHSFKCNRAGKHKVKAIDCLAYAAKRRSTAGEENTAVQERQVRTDPEAGEKSIASKHKRKIRLDGSPFECYFVSYVYGHGHALVTDNDDVGTQYLSAESREKIKRLLKGGGSVKEVLQRMQSSRERFDELGRTRIFRDDIITYEDVYIVYYHMMIKEIRKDEDPDVSTQLWIEQLAREEPPECAEDSNNEVNIPDGLEFKAFKPYTSLDTVTPKEILVARPTPLRSEMNKRDVVKSVTGFHQLTTLSVGQLGRNVGHVVLPQQIETNDPIDIKARMAAHAGTATI
ncbi:hypothetical protein BGX28_005604 [Mortierella sp. GBA30]|nr:hypothetical protein BGX28_005604 [Mortierella sp. GBA30]